MTTLQWPGWGVSGFELRLMPNTRSFVSPYNGSTQTLDLGGERWRAIVTLPPARSLDQGLQREAFFDQLAGGVNTLALWHLRTPRPRGTVFTAAPVAWAITDGVSPWPVTDGGSPWLITDGTPVLKAAVVAGANTCVIQSRNGRTVEAGDMLGIAGELKRVLSTSTANGLGDVGVTFAPRARADWPAYSTALTTTQPTATFQILGEVPTSWAPGLAVGASFELAEVPNP